MRASQRNAERRADRLAARRHRVDGRALEEQQFDQGLKASLRRGVERCETLDIRGVHVSPALKQELNDGLVSRGRGRMQRGPLAGTGDVHLGPVVQQVTHHGQLALAGRGLQGGIATAGTGARVHQVRAVGHQALDAPDLLGFLVGQQVTGGGDGDGRRSISGRGCEARGTEPSQRALERLEPMYPRRRIQVHGYPRRRIHVHGCGRPGLAHPQRPEILPAQFHQDILRAEVAEQALELGHGVVGPVEFPVTFTESEHRRRRQPPLFVERADDLLVPAHRRVVVAMAFLLEQRPLENVVDRGRRRGRVGRWSSGRCRCGLLRRA